jgi:hypothetical protein
MALQLVNLVAPCFSYPAYGGSMGGYYDYNPGLITPPKHYQVGNLRVVSFFYEPSNDMLIGYFIGDMIWWPGWIVYRLSWNASDGSLAEAYNVGTVFPIDYVLDPSAGSFGKIYSTFNTDPYVIQEVDWDTLADTNGGWSLNTEGWSPINILAGPTVVNLIDNLIVAVPPQLAFTLAVFDISNPSQGVLKGELTVPESVSWMAYQNRTYCWLVTAGGLILKCNYGIVPPRWEMLSSVQNPVSDSTGFYIAYDTQRSRVVVLRNRPDAVDGSCQMQLEFYYPVYQLMGLTDPVPVMIPRAGSAVRFVAHLYGTTGEGVTPFVIEAALAAPANGQLLTPWTGTALNGSATFRYAAPSFRCTDTLQLTSDVPVIGIAQTTTTSTSTSTTTSTSTVTTTTTT